LVRWLKQAIVIMIVYGRRIYDIVRYLSFIGLIVMRLDGK
jgi:hypothetical protein